MTQSTNSDSQDALHLVNRLNESRSPYVSPHLSKFPLLQTERLKPRDDKVRGHMSNPVAWQIWDTATLDLAKKYNRLLFVSIGYAACHCR